MSPNFSPSDHWSLFMLNQGKVTEFPVQMPSDAGEDPVVLKTDRVIISISKKELGSAKTQLNGNYTLIREKRSGSAILRIKTNEEIEIFPDADSRAALIMWTLKKTQ